MVYKILCGVECDVKCGVWNGVWCEAEWLEMWYMMWTGVWCETMHIVKYSGMVCPVECGGVE